MGNDEFTQKLSNLSVLQKTTELTEESEMKIKIRGFIYSQRVKGKRGFIIIRSGLETMQCTYSSIAVEDGLSAEDFETLRNVPTESFIELLGVYKSTPFEVKSCSVKNNEMQISKFPLISPASELPFSLRDVGASEAERNEKSHSTVAYNKCLDFRSLDMRTPHCHSIFKVVDGFMFYFREFLRKNEFMEIKTSKLIYTASEGGANCFKLDYFGKNAYLAQSPQLYKQMAIIGGFKRVYEISHVYRAEESNINRYLSEFVGMDFEMELETGHYELIKFVHEMFVHIFDSVAQNHSKEIEIIRGFRHFDNIKYTPEPLVFTHKQCVCMLNETGVEMDAMSDFNREAEKRLGDIVRNKHGVDFFAISEYPTAVRAFYTKPLSDEPERSCSFDFILRGEEVLSGARRINEYNELIESVEGSEIDKETLKGYLGAFKYGVPIHGGCGIGLERVMKSYFNFGDIRYFSMFPRDPTRIYP